MKNIRALIMVVLALSVVGGGTILWKLYGMFYNVILEAKDVQHLRVEESSSASPMRLKISGHPFYSGMIVRKISTTQKGSIITVLVHLAAIGLVKPKTSGVFEYDLSIPDSIDEVRFGRSATVIWERRASPAHRPNRP